MIVNRSAVVESPSIEFPDTLNPVRVPTDVNDDPVTALPSVYATPAPLKSICP